MAKDEKNIESYMQLVGTNYTDNDNQELYQNTRITLCDGFIVAYRAKVKSNGTIGNKEKPLTHVADVIKIMGIKPSRQKVVEEIWSKNRNCG